MIVLDVNVLVVGDRCDVAGHQPVKDWPEVAAVGPRTIGVPSLSLVGYLRLVTKHRVFAQPTALAEALTFCDALLAAPAVRRVSAGPGHRSSFRRLMTGLSLRSNEVPDAHLAAPALENDAVLRHVRPRLRAIPETGGRRSRRGVAAGWRRRAG
jgi:hypothetical protein